MKKVGKTTRPFRSDLNQIPCDCIVEVTNRFKGLDLVDRVPEELWMEVYNIVQEAMTKTIPKKKKCKKAKWLFDEALQIAKERREMRGKEERERYTQLNAEFWRPAGRHKKGFLNEQCKVVEENNRVGRTRDIFKKTGDTKGTFWASYVVPVLKNPPANAGDVGSIHGSGRSPRGGHGNSLQYSCLERSLRGYSPLGHKDSDMTECINNNNATCSTTKISGTWEGSGGEQTWRKREKIKGLEQTFGLYSLVLDDNFMCGYVYQTLNFTL